MTEDSKLINPTPADRAEARRLAHAILSAVRADERMPLYELRHVPSIARRDVESLIVQLAQEITAQSERVAELEGERSRLRAAIWAVIDMFEGACANFDSRGKGGQHVPYHGEFSSMTPSTRNQLGRWSYDLRQALSNEWPMTRGEFVAMFPDTPTDALDHMFKERTP
jgi:hypothetical protein